MKGVLALLLLALSRFPRVSSAGDKTVHLHVSPCPPVYNASFFGPLKRVKDEGEDDFRVPETGKMFIKCMLEKQDMGERAKDVSCAEKVVQFQRQKTNSFENRRLGQELGEKMMQSQGKETKSKSLFSPVIGPKRKMQSQNKGGNSKGLNRKFGPNFRQRETLTGQNESELRMKTVNNRVVGKCGTIYTVEKGAKITIKIPNKDTACAMAFEPSSLSLALDVRCTKFKLRNCKQEVFYLSSCNGAATFCGKSKLKKITKQCFYYVYYARLNSKKKNSKYKCVIRARNAKTTSTGSVSTSQAPGCNNACGVSPKLIASPKIVGGSEPEVGTYPWLVVIYIYRNEELAGQCSGSIITTEHILTAAHCTDFDDLTGLLVVAGEHDRSTDSETELQVIPAMAYTQHSSYDIPSKVYDIGIVVLREKLVWKDHVGPLCLPSSADHVGKTAYVAGWGTTASDESTSAVLLEAAVQVKSVEECKEAYSNDGYVSPTQVCASSPGKDSCQGDSGGPLVLREGKLFSAIGIVSFGIGCAEPDYPGVYTRVSLFNDWILRHVSSGSC